MAELGATDGPELVALGENGGGAPYLDFVAVWPFDMYWPQRAGSRDTFVRLHRRKHTYLPRACGGDIELCLTAAQQG